MPIPSVDLRCCDAMDGLRSLPDGSVDLVLSDFPYESLERHRSKGTTTRLKVSKASSNPWFPVMRNEQLLPLMAELYRVLKPARHTYLFCDDETGHLLWDLAGEVGFYPWKMLTWVKTVTGGEEGEARSSKLEARSFPWKVAADQVRAGTGYHYPGATERILFLEKRSTRYQPPPVPKPRPDPPGKGRRLLGGPFDRVRGQAGDVLFSPRAPGGYPTEKPVQIQKVLVAQSTSEGEVVLDPCMGSGSSLVAATGLGRSVVGFDVLEEAVQLAEQRVRLAVEALEVS